MRRGEVKKSNTCSLLYKTLSFASQRLIRKERHVHQGAGSRIKGRKIRHKSSKSRLGRRVDPSPNVGGGTHEGGGDSGGGGRFGAGRVDADDDAVGGGGGAGGRFVVGPVDNDDDGGGGGAGGSHGGDAGPPRVDDWCNDGVDDAGAGCVPGWGCVMLQSQSHSRRGMVFGTYTKTRIALM